MLYLAKSLTHILDRSHSVFLGEGKVIFDFGRFDLSCQVEFKNKLSEEKTEYYSVDFKRFPERFEKLTELECDSISYFINFRDRIEDRDFESSYSITFRFFEFYRVLCLKAGNTRLEYTYFTDYDGYDMCQGSDIYGIRIHLPTQLAENKEFITLLVVQDVGSAIRVPMFYRQDYINIRIRNDSTDFLVLTTQTKTRRLAYLKLLLIFIADNSSLMINSFNVQFEQYVENYLPQLESYTNSKGQIKRTKTGTSAQPYIDLSVNLGLIRIIRNKFVLSKISKVYIKIINNLDYLEAKNIFILSEFDKLFFLEVLLKQDYIYLSILLELLFIKEKTSLNFIIDNFQHEILSRIRNHKLEFSSFHSRPYLQKINEIEKRIKLWKKPKGYLEHVIMPRLNWLIDLDLVHSDDSKEITLTKNGNHLFFHFCLWNDINRGPVHNAEEFVDSFILQMFSLCYKFKNVNVIGQEGVEIALNDYLFDSFREFRTIAPNRVTASQAISYAKYMLYIKHDIALDHRQIVSYLNSTKQDKFIYKYQASAKDGYIQLKGV